MTVQPKIRASVVGKFFSQKKPLWQVLLALTGLGAVSASMGALLALSLDAHSPFHRQSQASATPTAIATSSLGVPQLNRPINILILGIKVLSSELDSPPATDPDYQAVVNSLDGLADTILLLRLDPEAQRVTLLSIPRDTRTWVEGYGYTKINEANLEGGAALSNQTVSDLLGVPIDRYVRVNVQGIEALVNALGGVDLYVPKAMKYQDHSQHLYINLQAGQQHLNGDQALQFLRYRYDEWGDIGRIQRQQSLIRALQEQALSPLTLTRLPQILTLIRSHLDTDLSVRELIAIAGRLAHQQRQNVQMLMLPGSFSHPEDYQASYWLPNPDQVQAMTAQHFSAEALQPPAIDPGRLRVAIQDSAKHPGAANALADQLLAAGYGETYQASADQEPLAVTRIIAQQGDIASAQALHQQLGLGEVRIESTGILNSDITIQIGQDWLAQSAAGGGDQPPGQFNQEQDKISDEW